MIATSADVAALIEIDRDQVHSARRNLITHLLLLDLLAAYPDAVTVGQALTAAGMTLDQYLAGAEPPILAGQGAAPSGESVTRPAA